MRLMMTEATPGPPSGSQVEIRSGAKRAVVVEVGGGLREYSIGGRAILDGYAEQDLCTVARGQALIPWPNRLEDGRYTFQGEDYQTPLSEPAQHNAIHGLTRWMNWQVVSRAPDQVVMGLRLHPQEGYPFELGLEIEYRVDTRGLSVRTTARNLGRQALPYAAGHHPYVTLGTPLIDELTLTVPAQATLELDGRQNATGRRLAVDGTELDFRRPRRLGQTRLDTAFTDLARGSDGLARLVVETAGGAGRLALWLDAAYPYVMVFTGDGIPDPARRRRGLGLEPMTSAPNGFRSGQGLQVIVPGAAFTSRWGLE